MTGHRNKSRVIYPSRPVQTASPAGQPSTVPTALPMAAAIPAAVISPAALPFAARFAPYLIAESSSTTKARSAADQTVMTILSTR